MINLIKEKIQSYQPRTITKQYQEAAVFLFLTNEVYPRIYFIKRAKHLKQHAGETAFPGGKKEASDINILETAYRESDEEIGIKKSQIEFIGMLDQQMSLYNLKISPFVGIIDSKTDFFLDQREVESIFSVEMQYFISKIQYSSYFRTINNQEVPLHQFFYQGHKIGGLTAFILVQFLEITCHVNFDFKPCLERI